MEWKVFAIDEEELVALGQEISNEVGRRIIASLRDFPKSPNDIANELGLPLTTVIFHIEKLSGAGIIKPLGKMPGKRGRKTLYSLASPAFVILPVSRVEKEGFLQNLIEKFVLPQRMLARSIIVGLMIAVVMVGLPWYFLGGVEYAAVKRAPSYTTVTVTTVATPTATIPAPLKGSSERSGSITGQPSPEGAVADQELLSKYEAEQRSKFYILLALIAIASLLSAIATMWVLRSGARPYSVRRP